MDSRPSPTPRTSATSDVSPIATGPSGSPASPGSPGEASPLPKRVVRDPRRRRFTNGAFGPPPRPTFPPHGPRPDSLALVLQRVALLGMLAVRNPLTHGDTTRHLTPGEAWPHRRPLTDTPGRRTTTPAEGAQISGSPLSG